MKRVIPLHHHLPLLFFFLLHAAVPSSGSPQHPSRLSPARARTCVSSGFAVSCAGSNRFGEAMADSASGEIPAWEARSETVWDAERDEATGAVIATAGVTSVVAGGHQTCAVFSDGAVHCCGAHPGRARAETGSIPVSGFVDPDEPDGPYDCGGSAEWAGAAAGLGRPARGMPRVPLPGNLVQYRVVHVAVASVAQSVCALYASGEVLCWGDNTYGQLGTGDTVDVGDDPGEIAAAAFLPLPAASPVIDLVAGAHHFCGLTRARELFCWGRSRGYGAHPVGGAVAGANIGDDAGEIAGLPAVALDAAEYPDTKIVAVAAGPRHNCIVFSYDPGAGRVAGNLLCFGEAGAYGALGDGGANTPDLGITTPLTGGRAINTTALGLFTEGSNQAFAVAAGADHSCAVFQGTVFFNANQGRALCWGRGERLGQKGVAAADAVGDADGELAALPALDVPASVFLVVAAEEHTCAAAGDPTGPDIQCWGEGSSHRLATPDTAARGGADSYERNFTDGSTQIGGDAGEWNLFHVFPTVIHDSGGATIYVSGPPLPALRNVNQVKLSDICGGENSHTVTSFAEDFLPTHMWFSANPIIAWDDNTACGPSPPLPVRVLSMEIVAAGSSTGTGDVVSFNEAHLLVIAGTSVEPVTGPASGGFAPRLSCPGFELLEHRSLPLCHLSDGPSPASADIEIVRGVITGGKLHCNPFSAHPSGTYYMHARLHDAAIGYPKVYIGEFEVLDVSGGVVSPPTLPISGGDTLTVGSIAGMNATVSVGAMRFTHAASGTTAVSQANISTSAAGAAFPDTMAAAVPAAFAALEDDALLAFPLTVQVELSPDGEQFIDVGHTVTLYRGVVPTSITPSIMVSTATEPFTITAARLFSSASPVVRFSQGGGTAVDVAANAVTVPPDTAVTGNTPAPALSASGVWTVSVALNGLSFAAQTLTLFVFEITSLSPLSGPRTGGTNVIVGGIGFTNGANLKCKFSLTDNSEIHVVDASLLSESEITCASPPVLTATASFVTISPDDGTVPYTTPDEIYTYVSGVYDALVPAVAPAPSYHNPGIASDLYPSLIEVHGSGFFTSTIPYCRFNDFILTANIVSLTVLTCESPKQAGVYDVTIAENGEDFLPGNPPLVLFLYTVLLVRPTVLPATGAGRDVVTLIGENFNVTAGAAQVCLVGATAVPANVVSDSIIECDVTTTAPVGAEISVEVALSTDAGGTLLYSSELRNFTFAPAPDITHVTPSAVPWTGGVGITLYGTNLPTNETSVAAGGGTGACIIGNTTVRALQLYVSGTTIVCSTPQRTSPAPIGVSINSGVSFDFFSGFDIVFMRVFSLTPSLGPGAGGSDVLISGIGFRSGGGTERCRVGRKGDTRDLPLFLNPVPAVVLGDGRARCVMPERIVLRSDRTYDVPVEFSVDGETYTDDKILFTYFTSPQVTFVDPPGSPSISSGSEVTIHGVHFDVSGFDPLCTYGGEPINATNIDYNSNPLKAEAASVTFVPRVTGDSSVPIKCSLNEGFDFNKEEWSFSVIRYDVLEVVSGPRIGGTTIEITGAGFQNTDFTSCVFSNSSSTIDYDNAVVVPATALSPGTLSCVTPPIPAGADRANGGDDTVLVDLTMDKVQYTLAARTFTYFDLPVVTSLVPTTGPSTGGTMVTIWASPGTLDVNGTAASGGEWVCQFGASLTNSSGILDPATGNPGAVCSSPPGVATVTLSLSLNGGADFQNSWSVPRLFSYTNVLYIDPASGPSSGGTSVYVSGSGILDTGANKCRFGASTTVDALVLSELQVLCKSPSLAPGTYPVEISNDGTEFTADGLVFVYYGTPAVTALAPAAGPVEGGSSVTAHGINFVSPASLTQCSFGPVSDGAVAVPSLTAVSCRSPPAADLGLGASRISVEVSVNNGFDFTTNRVEFLYYLVETLSPDLGPRTGGTIVTVRGAGFSSSVWGAGGTGRCKWSGLPSTPTDYIDAVTISCPSPNLIANNGTDVGRKVRVLFSLTVEGDVTETVTPLSFAYYLNANITDWAPAHSPSSGGIKFVMTADEWGFENVPLMACRFGESVVSAVFLTALSALCIVPPNRNAGEILGVSFAHNGQDFVPVGNVTYFRTLSIHPRRGPSSGGTLVQVRGLGFPDPRGSDFDLTCRLGPRERAKAVTAKFISSTLITCITAAALPPSAPLPPGFDPDKIGRRRSLGSGGGEGGEGGADLSRADHDAHAVWTPPVGSDNEWAMRMRGPGAADLDGGEDDVIRGDGDAGSPAAGGVAPRGRFVAEERVVLETFLAVAADNFAYTEAALEGATDFLYYLDPDVTFMSPTRGPGSGGTLVTMLGRGFSDVSLHCFFGAPAEVNVEAAPVEAVFVSTTKILCTSMVHDYGVSQVLISMNDQQYSRRPLWPVFIYEECEEGYAAPEFSDPCTPCPVGEFSNVRGAKRCQKCDPFHYANATGQLECQHCPNNTKINVIERYSVELCECLPGFFSPIGAPGVQCEPCPKGASCDGGVAHPRALPGFWVESPDSVTFLTCEHEPACPGQVSESCAAGYRGRLCADCEANFFRTGKNCRPCPGYAKYLILLLPTYVLSVSLLLWISVGPRMTAYSGSITVMGFFFQTLGILARLKLNWPERLHDAFSVTSSLFSLNIDILALECADPTISFQVRWVSMMGSPIAFIMGFAAIATVSAMRRSLKHIETPARPGARRGTPRHFFLNAFIRWLSMMYLILLATSLQLFDCTRQVDGKLTLDASPNLVCFDPWWHRLMPIGAFAMAAYGVLIPVGVYLLLHGSRRRRRMPMTVARVGSLFAFYRFYYWESFALFEKFLVATSLTYFSATVDIQIITFLLVTITGLALHVLLQPYYLRRHNTLSTFLRWASVFLLILGGIFRSGQFPDDSVEPLVESLSFIVMLLSLIAVVVVVIKDATVQRRARKYFGPEMDDHLTALVHPHGKTDIMEWLGSKSVNPVIAADAAAVFANLYDYLLNSTVKPLHLDAGRIADELIDEYASGIFYDKTLPFVRSFVAEAATATQTGSSAAEEEKIKTFVGVIGALKKHNFLRDVAKG